MKCVAYVRVSSRDQDVNVQLNSLVQFATSHNIEIVKTYVDHGESGAKLFSERESSKLLLSELDVLKPECILVWSIDRLGRGMLDTLNTIIQLENKGVKVISVKEEFLQSLDPQIRKLILSVLTWIAEFERRRIRERQEEAWRQGKQKGRPQKVSDDVILKYYRDYVVKLGLSIVDMWKIMKSDGYDISYDRLRKRIKQLEKQGRIVKEIKIEGSK